MCNTCSVKHFTSFVAVLIWRDTDEMPLKSSETTDSRVIGIERRMVARQQETYVCAIMKLKVS